MNIYKMLWSKIGGRPWTYISRDIWHKFEYFPIIIFFLLGFLFRHYITNLLYYFMMNLWLFLIFTLSVLTIGYIFGHFFWGESYIPDQKGNGND